MSTPNLKTPLRRHSALAPLSRDHHHALVLARRVQRGVARSGQGEGEGQCASRALADDVCARYERELLPHFAAEEELLVEGLRYVDAELDALGRDIVREHAELRAIVMDLAQRALPVSELDALLDRFGKLLESHVRKEERVVFVRIQELLDEPALNALEEELSRRRPQ